jgi:hypothetical protein
MELPHPRSSAIYVVEQRLSESCLGGPVLAAGWAGLRVSADHIRRPMASITRSGRLFKGGAIGTTAPRSQAQLRTRTGDPFLTISERVRAAAGCLRISPDVVVLGRH